MRVPLVPDLLALRPWRALRPRVPLMLGTLTIQLEELFDD